MALVKINNRGQRDNLGRRNILINGDMRVAQRGTSTTGLQNTGGVFTIDRFSHRRGGTWTNFEAKHEQVDVTDALPLSVGLTKALKVTCTTAEGSVPSGTGSASNAESVAIGHYLEKGDTHRFSVGTSSMSVTTLSFYVKASIATTYGISLSADQHSAHQRIQIPFTVSSANTYERISITIPTYTAALDSDADTSAGWRLHIMLDGVASAKSASTWHDNSSNSEQVVMLPNGVSTTGFSNTLNATFEITGVQLEKGSVATEFEHRLLGDELQLCQRYFYPVCPKNISGQSIGMAYYYVTTTLLAIVHFPVKMRAVPQITSANSAGYFTTTHNDQMNYLLANRITDFNVELYNNDQVSGTAMEPVIARSNNNNAFIHASAEL